MAKGDSVYQIITDRILDELAKGTIPWRKPWVGSGAAVSWKTQKAYRGINQLLLPPGEYITWKQASEVKGAKIKEGQSKNFMIAVFWKWLNVNKDEDGTELDEEKKIPFLRYYRVYDINQFDGIKSKRKDVPEFKHDPIEAAEKIIAGYADCPPISFGSSAFYRPGTDTITVPPVTAYPNVEEFYSTQFHEMIHSTGHSKRLNRSGIMDKAAAFGSETYSKEELVAEIGAAMLCGIVGIENATIENSAAYIKGWSSKIKGDEKFVIQAASAAQKAADYIQGIKWEQ